MGNRIVCCRQRWSQLYDSDEKISKNLSNVKVSYNNPAANFSGDVWRTSSSSGIHGAFDLNQISQEHVPRIVKSNVTQHIKEREPEDTEFDPSLNASRRALFISGFRHGINGSTSPENRFTRNQFPTTPGPTCKHGNHHQLTSPLKRWSSCSTIYIGDSCLAHLNQKSTLWGVSVGIGLLVRSEKNQRFSAPVRPLKSCHFSKPSAQDHDFSSEIYEDVYKIFDERVYSLERYPSGGPTVSVQPDIMQNPKAGDVHQFLCRLFDTALLGPECAIVALIFLERLVNAAEVGILPWSWRRQLLACILLASKVLDDQAVWNTDYCQILRDVCVDDLNALERHTLALLQFNIDVQPAVYARYYFDLLYVAQASGVANQPSERRRLTTELAQQLRILPARTNDLTSSDAGFLFDLPRIDPLHAKSRGSARDPHLQPTNTRKRSAKHRTISTEKRKIQTTGNIEPNKPNTVILNSSHSGDLSRPSVVSPRGTTVNPPSADNPDATGSSFAESAVMFTLEPIPAARSPNPEDEGPLQLDDETDLINTLTVSLVASPSSGAPVVSADTSQYGEPYSSRTHNRPWVSFRPSGDTGISDPRSTRWDTFQSQDYNSVRISSNDTNLNSSGFIRTLMGGDVAYSLLRDAGMY